MNIFPFEKLFVIVIFVITTFFISVHSKGIRVHTGKRHIAHTNSRQKQSNIQKVSSFSTPYRRMTTHLLPTYNSRQPSETKKREGNLAKKTEETSSSHPPSHNDPIQASFDDGVRNIFKLIGTYFSSENADNHFDLDKIHLPAFLPSTFPFAKYDLTHLIKLLNAKDDSEIEQLAETAFVDTISQLVGFMGLDDLQEWMHVILASILMGPILIPLFWLPISFFGMLGLLFPLFLFNPPSKLNTNVLGHDPIKHSEGEERSFPNFFFQSFNDPESRKTNRNITTISSSSVVDSCVERFACQITRFYHDNPISQWLARRFNSTKVEWARLLPDFGANGTYHHHDRDDSHTKLLQYSKEDCKKYSCPMVPFNA